MPLYQLLPSKKVPDGVMSTCKYTQIFSSIKEVGLIEPRSILHPDAKKSEYLLLDGHLRVLALKELGLHEAPCLFAKGDETYTYDHRVNRLCTITVAHVEALLKATPPEQRADVPPPERDSKTAPME